MANEKEQKIMGAGLLKTADLPETRLTQYAWFLGICWTFFILGFLALDIIDLRHDTEHLAIKEARANFNKDQAFRYWAASHGGIYVPVTEKTPPNPYLKHIPERDITTPSGIKLTLMNPAYVVRQMNERFKELYGIAGHITSLNLHRPQNAPDEWERKALMAFERGEKEVMEFSEIDGKPYIRLMEPMMTVKGCLKCHAYQGYKVGDVRGGVSVSVPLSDLYAHEWGEIVSDVMSHSAIWVVGLIAIFTGYRRLRRHLRERERDSEALSRWGEIFRHAGWGVVIGSAQTKKIEMMNEHFASMHGWSVDELTGKAIADIYAPQCREEAALNIKKAIESGHCTFESTHIRKDGSVFPVLKDVAVVRDSEGKSLYLIANVQDISELKAAEKELRLSEKRLNRGQEVGQVGTWDWNPETGELLWSDEVYRILGYEPKEIIPSYELFLNHLTTDDRKTLNNAVQRALSEREIYNIDCRVVRKDGSEIIANARGEVSYDESGNPLQMVGTFQDITERKKTEERLREQLEELRRWNSLNLDREERVIELKEEVNALLRELGREERYSKIK